MAFELNLTEFGRGEMNVFCMKETAYMHKVSDERAYGISNEQKMIQGGQSTCPEGRERWGCKSGWGQIMNSLFRVFSSCVYVWEITRDESVKKGQEDQ